MDDNKLETWENTTQGHVYVWKRDVRGVFTDAIVGPNQKFSLSRDDRIYNMDRAANKELDNFSNGTLAPVRLLEGTEDEKEFANNPNLISGSDMRNMFKGHWKTFESRINSITNTATLERLLAMAEEADATVRQMKLIKARLDEINPATYVERTSMPLQGNAVTLDAPSSRGGVTPR